MKTAVIYARYSSDNQSEQSIEGQLRVKNMRRTMTFCYSIPISIEQ